MPVLRRHGVPGAQARRVQAMLGDLGPATIHHGCCRGADAQFARIAVMLTRGVINVIGHPSTLTNWTSVEALKLCDETRDKLAPLTRNRVIVDTCELLIACPAGYAEEQRSGTWATIRYARKLGRALRIVWPDGRVTEEG